MGLTEREYKGTIWGDDNVLEKGSGLHWFMKKHFFKLVNVHLRFVHFTESKCTLKEKPINQYWHLGSDIYAEIFRVSILMPIMYFGVHLKIRWSGG